MTSDTKWSMYIEDWERRGEKVCVRRCINADIETIGQKKYE